MTKEEQREYNRKWREAHPDYYKQYYLDNADKFREYYLDNTDKIKEYSKRYYLDNVDKIKERKKQYYLDNTDKIKEYSKQYRIDNVDKIKEIKKQYYLDHAEKQREYNRKWRESHPDYYKHYGKTKCGRALNLVTTYDKNDKDKGFDASYNITRDWLVQNIFSGQKCIYCGDSDWTHLGCDRIDNSKPHTPDNVVCCCEKCNKQRGYHYTVEEFKEMKELERIKNELEST